MFGVQPFRHFVPGFTLLRDQMQVWIHDRMGCFALELFTVSTDEEYSRQRLVEMTLAFVLMDGLRWGLTGMYLARRVHDHVGAHSSCPINASGLALRIRQSARSNFLSPQDSLYPPWPRMSRHAVFPGIFV